MRRRIEMLALFLLLLVLGYVFYSSFRPSGATARVPISEARFQPVDVDNPALRLDILKRFLDLEYKGVHRNIFSATLPPTPPPPASKNPPGLAGPPVPAGPPPLHIDAKYFGYVSDTQGNHRRAFFASSDNENVYIAGEGDTLMGLFRVVRLTNTTADVEEIATGRQVTLIMEQPGPNG
jgi:hypothetical protein